MVRVLMTFRIYMITGYVLALILMGWILSKIVFPILGRWIVDLNFRLQNKMRKDGQRNRQWLKKHLNLK